MNTEFTQEFLNQIVDENITFSEGHTFIFCNNDSDTPKMFYFDLLSAKSKVYNGESLVDAVALDFGSNVTVFCPKCPAAIQYAVLSFSESIGAQHGTIEKSNDSFTALGVTFPTDIEFMKEQFERFVSKCSSIFISNSIEYDIESIAVPKTCSGIFITDEDSVDVDQAQAMSLLLKDFYQEFDDQPALTLVHFVQPYISQNVSSFEILLNSFCEVYSTLFGDSLTEPEYKEKLSLIISKPFSVVFTDCDEPGIAALVGSDIYAFMSTIGDSDAWGDLPTEYISSNTTEPLTFDSFHICKLNR